MKDYSANRNDGFGILEVVVTVAMMLIIIAVMVPMLLQSINGLQLGADAQNIASELQLAKFKASSQGTPYQVWFDANSATAQLQKYNGASFQNEGSALAVGSSTTFIATPASVPSGALASVNYPTGIRFNMHGVPIDGTGAPIGNNGVYLGNGSTILYAITVPLSGRVQLWWYDGSQWNLQ